MSGDVQQRKRKDKRRRRDEDEECTVIPRLRSSSTELSDNTTIHIHKETGTGGHWFAKLIFFGLMAALLFVLGLIILEHRGNTEVSTPATSSQWAMIFEGWVDNSMRKSEGEYEYTRKQEQYQDEITKYQDEDKTGKVHGAPYEKLENYLIEDEDDDLYNQLEKEEEEEEEEEGEREREREKDEIVKEEELQEEQPKYEQKQQQGEKGIEETKYKERKIVEKEVSEGNEGSSIWERADETDDAECSETHDGNNNVNRQLDKTISEEKNNEDSAYNDDNSGESYSNNDKHIENAYENFSDEAGFASVERRVNSISAEKDAE